SVAAPMGGHLTAAGGRIIGCTHCLQKHFERGRAQAETQGAVTIVGIEPVVGRFKGERCGYADGLVAGAGDLKEDFLLALEEDLPVVQPPGQVHGPISLDELVARKTFIGLAVVYSRMGAFGLDFCSSHLPLAPSSDATPRFLGHCKTRDWVPNILDFKGPGFLTHRRADDRKSVV